MKKLILKLILIVGLCTVFSAWATQGMSVTNPPNPVSQGQSESSGVSHAPSVDREEQQENRVKAGSMGGAPNSGMGMGTGTGAGSKVGKKLKVRSNDEIR